MNRKEAIKRLSVEKHGEDFLRQVNKSGGCWFWSGYKHRDGYGEYSGCGHALAAHRVSYLFFNGPLIDGLVIDHICRVRECVNPAHLRQVSFEENQAVLRFQNIGFCKHGHSYHEGNVSRYRGICGVRERCIICKRARNREHMRRVRAKCG